MGDISQNLPENSVEHLQVYSLTPSIQVPPFCTLMKSNSNEKKNELFLHKEMEITWHM